MTNSQFEQISKSMKQNSVDISLLTKMVNVWLDGTAHVCEQEMMNYIIKNEPMPEDVEQALLQIFDPQEVDRGGNCPRSVKLVRCGG